MLEINGLKKTRYAFTNLNAQILITFYNSMNDRAWRQIMKRAVTNDSKQIHPERCGEQHTIVSCSTVYDYIL